MNIFQAFIIVLIKLTINAKENYIENPPTAGVGGGVPCPVMCALSGGERSSLSAPGDHRFPECVNLLVERPVKGRNNHQLLNNSDEQLECHVPCNSVLSFTDHGTGKE